MTSTDWPDNWLPLDAWLSALGTGGKTRDALARAIPLAERAGLPMNFGYANNALKRLLKLGLVDLDTKTGIYTPKGRSYTEDEIREACEAIGRDPAPLLAALRGEIEPDATEAEPAPRTLTHPAPFAGSTAEAVAACRAILRDNEAQALTIAEWDELARADGIDLASLMRSHREELLAGTACGERDEVTTYYLTASVESEALDIDPP